MTRSLSIQKDPDLDTVLRVLASPTRREILARLATETHYPLQLSRELGVSQQAIMKHMKVLEDAGMVRGVEEPSDQGGPPRTAFELTCSLSLSIDLGRSLFSTRIEILDRTGRAENRREQEAPEAPRQALALRLSDLSREVSDTDREIRHLEHRRGQLVSRKVHVLNEAYALISRMTDEYLSRRLLYFITESDDVSIPMISERFNLRERVVQELYRDLLRAHLVPEYKIRRLR